VEHAVFPALCLRPADKALWEEDAEEYVLRNLPSEADEPSGAGPSLFPRGEVCHTGYRDIYLTR
jgi:hypothetical protein